MHMTIIGGSVQGRRLIKLIFFANAHSIHSKFSDLEDIIITENYNVIGITKMWIKTKRSNFLAEYKLPRYTVF